MIENPEIETMYASLLPLDWSVFDSGSFLRWNNNAKLFYGIPSVEEILERIVGKFPHVQLVRGAGLENPIGATGDFFVGNIQSALKYTVRDTMQNPRKYPILVFTPLVDAVGLIQTQRIRIKHFDGDLPRLIHNGVINLQPLLASELNHFQIVKPPVHQAVPSSLYTTMK